MSMTTRPGRALPLPPEPGAATRTAQRTPASTGASQARAPRPRDTASGVRVSILLAIALALAVGNLHGVLSGVFWWVASLVPIVVVFAVATLTRVLLRRRGWGTLTAAAASLGLLTLMFAADTAFVGVVPTSATWDRFATLIAEGGQSITEQATPAEATPGILFLLCWAAAGLALVLDILASWWRVPALAGIPLLVVLAVPSTIDPELADPFFFALVAIVYLLLLRPRIGRSRPPVAIGLGAVAVVGALVLPLLLPPVTQPGESGPNGGLTTGINPMLDLGEDLRRNSPTQALTYSTTAPGGQYLRLTTLEQFVGDEWEPVSITPIPNNTVSAFGTAPGLSTAVSTSPATTNITIDNASGRWLPVPYPAAAISGLEGDWFWEPNGLSVRTADANMRGQQYEVTSLEVQPTSTQLEQAGSSSSLPLAEVPEGLDPQVALIAQSVVAGAATDYDRAVALQDWFRGGEFTYSEDAPVEEGFDGSGLDVLVPFLEAKTGYCVHFSSAMAVMARTLGIPSRVVVGFLPGDEDDSAEAVADVDLTSFSVSSRDLHAWPELYFEGSGWIRFEPTPGRGVEPVYLPTPVDNPSTPDIDESLVTPTPTATAAPPVAATPTPTPTANALGGSPESTRTLSLWALAIGLGVLLLLAAPWLARSAIRGARFGSIRAGRLPATAAWFEVMDTARDLGYRDSTTGTPRELENRLRAAGISGEPVVALGVLREAVEREVYSTQGSANGPPGDQTRSSKRTRSQSVDTSETSAALHTVLSGLRTNAGPAARLRATLVPGTIRDRIRGIRVWSVLPRP
jgi:transglutaminase-like putative cysteine protease